MSRYAAERTRGGGIQYRAPEGRWIARVQVDGVRYTGSRLGPDTPKGRQAAEAMRRQLERDARRGVVELRRGPRRWALDDLCAASGAGPRRVAEILGYADRTGHRWAHQPVRLTDAEADLAATRLGEHPSWVWKGWDA